MSLQLGNHFYRDNPHNNHFEYKNIYTAGLFVALTYTIVENDLTDRPVTKLICCEQVQKSRVRLTLHVTQTLRCETAKGNSCFWG